MSVGDPSHRSDAETASAADEWRRLLVTEKSPPSHERHQAQHELLEAVNDSASAFARLVRHRLRLGEEPWNVPSLGQVLDGEITNPQAQTGQVVWEALKAGGWTRSQASDENWWLRAFASWAEEGLLPDPPGPTLTDGVPTAALASPTEWTADTSRNADQAIRNLLRRTGGIPHIRRQGALTVMDCPIAEVWWRTDLARSASGVPDEGGPTFEATHQMFHLAEVWGRRGKWVLPKHLFRRTPRLAHPHALAGFVLAAQRQPIFIEGTAETMLNRLASRSLLVDFDYISPTVVAELCV